MALQTPNYTQVPNSLFEQMGDMSEAELKVTLAVVRMTIGYHQERKRMSLSYLEQATGLSRSAANAGIKAALERGTVKRIPYKNSFEYLPNFANEDAKQSTKATDNGSKKLPKSVAKNYSNKETSKETNKNNGDNSQKSVTRQHSKEYMNSLFNEICRCFFSVDPLRLPKRFPGGRVGDIQKLLMNLYEDMMGEDLPPHEIVSFRKWVEKKLGACSLRSLPKMGEYFTAYLQERLAAKDSQIQIQAPVIHPVTLTDAQRKEQAAKLAAEAARLQDRANVTA